MFKVKSKHSNENGFIPLLITLFLVVVIIVYLVYSRVHNFIK
jgi:hypothetical protein